MATRIDTGNGYQAGYDDGYANGYASGDSSKTLWSITGNASKFYRKWEDGSAYPGTNRAVSANESGIIVFMVGGNNADTSGLSVSGTVSYRDLGTYTNGIDASNYRYCKMRIVAYYGGASGGTIKLSSGNSWGAHMVCYAQQF